MSKKKPSFSHIFPIVDAMVEVACKELEQNGEPISCKAGCDHCCYLFIEVSWEEAEELADWILKQPEKLKFSYIGQVLSNAKQARQVIQQHSEAAHLYQPYRGESQTPDVIFEEYFYKGDYPCPFLEEGRCQAYESRPTACRLHMVSSDANLCSRKVTEDSEYDIPERVEELKEQSAPAIEALERDGRWGHLGIMVEAVLVARGLLYDQEPLLSKENCRSSKNAA